MNRPRTTQRPKLELYTHFKIAPNLTHDEMLSTSNYRSWKDNRHRLGTDLILSPITTTQNHSSLQLSVGVTSRSDYGNMQLLRSII